MARKATVYQRGRRYIVNRVDTTTDGIPISTDDITVLPMDVTDDDLGEVVLAAVSRAREGVAPPDAEGWTRLLRPLLQAAGVKTWGAFVRGCKDVSVFEDADVIRMLPSVNRGEAEGFGPSGAAPRESSDDPVEVGRAVKETLASSR